MNYPTPQTELHSVAIFGSADLPEDNAVCRDAFTTAKLLAQRGYTVVNGGGPGVMQAATQGAESAGGDTVAITLAPKDAPHFEGTSIDNQADVTIKTDDYLQRVGLLIEKSDAFVVFQGGTGTLSELGLIWLLAHIYYGHHKPFVLVGTFWHEFIEQTRKNFLIEDVELKVFKIVDRVEEILPALDELVAEKQQAQLSQQ
jgi:uncharacterized protein (TIGR00730 family)